MYMYILSATIFNPMLIIIISSSSSSIGIISIIIINVIDLKDACMIRFYPEHLLLAVFLAKC